MNRHNAALIRSGIMFARAGWPLEASDHWPPITRHAHRREMLNMESTGRKPCLDYVHMHATRHNLNKQGNTMTTFNDYAVEGYRLDIGKSPHTTASAIRFMSETERGSSTAIYLDSTDDAAIALAVMEAAQYETQNGDPGSADYARNEAINWLMTARDRAAKEAITTKRDADLNKRRGEVCKELGAFFTPNPDDTPFRRAVDLIIELRDTP